MYMGIEEHHCETDQCYPQDSRLYLRYLHRKIQKWLSSVENTNIRCLHICCDISVASLISTAYVFEKPHASLLGTSLPSPWLVLKVKLQAQI